MLIPVLFFSIVSSRTLVQSKIPFKRRATFSFLSCFVLRLEWTSFFFSVVFVWCVLCDQFKSLVIVYGIQKDTKEYK